MWRDCSRAVTGHQGERWLMVYSEIHINGWVDPSKPLDAIDRI